ncbi:hypothetical protein Tco_0326054, partial [Tanacetum coccineum]
GVLIAEFSAGSAVNLALKMKGDMIIKNLDLKPTIDVMMRDLSKSLKRVHASDRDSPRCCWNIRISLRSFAVLPGGKN